MSPLDLDLSAMHLDDSHAETLERYAELMVVHGIGVQPGQVVTIGTEAVHRELALAVMAKAYDRGAKVVELDLSDPRAGRIRAEHSEPEHLEFVPAWATAKATEICDVQGATLRIIGSEAPDVLAGLDAQVLNTMRVARYKALKVFYDRGINQSQVHWSIAAAATPQWAQQVFPEMDDAGAACRRLWEAIFTVCRADRPDCLDLWRAHNATLARRARTLSEMGIDALHFGGPGTNLTVGLSPKARFKGGADTGPNGGSFEPNIPTEECFTTPDYRRTEGTARATRPFLVNGTMVEGLEMTFSEGVMTDFKATAGADVYGAYIDSDEGARRLGEVALVGVDSPIFKSGIVFREILFDENAACHIAVGSAYKACLEGGETMPDEQLAELGCNESSAHLDMMISDEQTTVTAVLQDGNRTTLLEAGRWVGELA